jgi:hypothetical protein
VALGTTWATSRVPSIVENEGQTKSPSSRKLTRIERVERVERMEGDRVRPHRRNSSSSRNRHDPNPVRHNRVATDDDGDERCRDVQPLATHNVLAAHHVWPYVVNREHGRQYMPAEAKPANQVKTRIANGCFNLVTESN